jgi:cysteine synthase A
MPLATLLPSCTAAAASLPCAGISLALVCAARGYECHLVAPHDVSEKKIQLITSLGATVELVPPAGIADAGHAVNVARRRAAALGPGSIFADQFENLANMCVLPLVALLLFTPSLPLAHSFSYS